MASMITNAGAAGLTGGGINWTSDTIKARLCTAGTFDKDDTSMTGKTAATGSTDITLTSPTKTTDTTNDRIVYTATSPLSWSGLSDTGSATWIAIYKFVTNDAGSTPIFYIDITDQALTGATAASYTIPGTGLGYLQQ